MAMDIFIYLLMDVRYTWEHFRWFHFFFELFYTLLYSYILLFFIMNNFLSLILISSLNITSFITIILCNLHYLINILRVWMVWY